jgi:hypothetical protein
MEALGDYLHAKGLKFGIYSSPGPLTCDNVPGSQGYEQQDANTYAAWGVDFLKMTGVVCMLWVLRRNPSIEKCVTHWTKLEVISYSVFPRLEMETSGNGERKPGESCGEPIMIWDGFRDGPQG